MLDLITRRYFINAAPLKNVFYAMSIICDIKYVPCIRFPIILKAQTDKVKRRKIDD